MGKLHPVPSCWFVCDFFINLEVGVSSKDQPRREIRGGLSDGKGQLTEAVVLLGIRELVED